jgi:hypothetical protein
VSKQIITLAVAGDINAFTWPAIVHITAYWLTKSYGKTKAKELILSLVDIVTIIDANYEVTLKALN